VLLTDDLDVPLMQVSFENTLLTDALIAPLMQATLRASTTVGGRDDCAGSHFESIYAVSWHDDGAIDEGVLKGIHAVGW